MLRLVSWNVRYFSHATRGITSLDATIQGVAEALTEVAPDVIALQEVDDWSIRSVAGRVGRRGARSQLERFLTALNGASARRDGPRYRAWFYPAHNHARRLPIISTGLVFLHRDDLEPVASNSDAPHEITHRRIRALGRFKQRRVCAWLRLAAPGGEEVDLFNTHLSLPAFLQRHPGPGTSRFGNAGNQLHELESALDFTASRPGERPSVLVGDFNSVPDSRVYRHVLRRSRFRDGHAAWLDSDADMNAHPTAGFAHLRYRLDHVFGCDRVHLTGFDRTSPFGSEHPFHGLSDHSPLAFTVELDEA